MDKYYQTAMQAGQERFFYHTFVVQDLHSSCPSWTSWFKILLFIVDILDIVDFVVNPTFIGLKIL